MRRRALLKQASGVTTAALLAGCSSFTESDEESPSPGEVVVRNNHTVPHIITIQVQDGPEGPLGNPITPQGQVALEPGEERTYPDWLRVGSSGITGGEYTFEIQMDNGRDTQDFQINPTPINGPPMYVTVELGEGGGLGWSVIAIHND